MNQFLGGDEPNTMRHDAPSPTMTNFLLNWQKKAHVSANSQKCIKRQKGKRTGLREDMVSRVTQRRTVRASAVPCRYVRFWCLLDGRVQRRTKKLQEREEKGEGQEMAKGKKNEMLVKK
jgi:hypothetical protein